MDESLRSALTDYVNQHGGAAAVVESVELRIKLYGETCECCEDDPTLDINYRDGAGKYSVHEVYDSELNDLLLFLLKAVPQ